MDIEDALLFTDTLVFNQTGLHLGDLQQAMLRESWSWQRQSYDQIADTYGYSATYLKHDVGPKLWKLLSEVIGEKVNKKNFRAAIERQFQKGALLHTSSPDSPQSIRRPMILLDWGDASEVHNFYGRSTELTQLQDWILSQKCQLVTILGMGGMGKTSLATKLAHLLESEFEAIIWRSLRNALPLGELLADWLKLLFPLQINNLETVDSQLSRLLQVLRSQRCLLILDNVETILEEREISHYREGYEKYGELFRLIGDTQHYSTLVLTSRQKPADVNVLEGATRRVRSLTLGGLQTTEGQKVFQERGAFQGSQDEWNRLIEGYSGNPLALKMISTTIQNLFDSNISDFLNQETFVFGTIRNLIQQQFERLSSSEKAVIYWLAIYRTPATFAELKLDIFPSIAPQKLIETLESLEQRALIERNAAQFSLQPVVMEYVTASFVEKIAQEIQYCLQCKPSLFKTHAIIKAQAKDYVRDAQIRLIVKPIIEQLKENLETEIEPFLVELVKKLQQRAVEVGYAGGNIINLLCQLQNHLSNYDFSNLTIWQANLQQTNLHNIDFSNSDLSRSLFTETLGIVFSVAFSPDGTKLATGDVEGGLRLWEVATSKLLLNFEGHIGWVWSIAFTPDGRMLASCSSDKTIRLWDTQTKECINILTGHTSSIWSVAFSPNGEMIASGGDEPMIRVWDVKSGECSKTLSGHTGRILSVAFSPDGKMLASGSDDCTIRIWNVSTGECQTILEGHTNHIWSVVFSGEGNTLASGSADHSIRLWDVSNNTCVDILKSHSGCVRALQFSSNHKLLISSSDDQTIRVWDLRDKLKNSQCLHVLSGHTNAVFSISFNNVDGTIASGSTDQTVRFWNVQTGRCLKTLRGYTNSVFSIAYSTCGLSLASGSTDQLVRLWDINTGKCLKTLQGHQDWVTCVAFHTNGKWLASSSVDRTIRLWDICTGTCIKTLHGHTSWVQSVAFSPNGTLLASASDDQTLRLWDVNTFTCLKTLYGHTNWIWAVAFSPDGNLLASSSEDATIRLWSVNTGECINILEGHTSRIQSIAFHPDGQILSSASGDQTVRLWSVMTGQCLNVLQGHENTVWSVNFSPDGEILASSSLDQSMRIWDKMGTCIQTFSIPTHSVRSSIVLREVEAHQYTLTSGSRNGVINIYDVSTGNCLKILTPDRPYQGTNITGVTGITEAQRDALKANGAIELW